MTVLTHILPVCVCMLLCACCCVSAQDVGHEAGQQTSVDTHIIAHERMTFSVDVAGVIQASQSEQIVSPVYYKPVEYVIADGSYVTQGQVITRFNPLYEDKQYERDLIKKQAIDFRLEGRLLAIDNKEQVFIDSMKEQESRLKVLQARMQRLESLPLESDIIIATGSLRIAELEYNEAQSAWQQAQRRFEKGFLSQSENKEFHYAQRSAQARLVQKQTMLSIAQMPVSVQDLAIARIEKENVELALRKIYFEKNKQEKIIEINKIDARRRAKTFAAHLDEKKEMLQSLVIRSPVNGYIMYTARFKKSLQGSSGKTRKGQAIMTIPHADNLYIHATIPEQFRQFIDQGNRCMVSTLGSQAAQYAAQITSISSRPQDILSDGVVRWGAEDQESGVKVYTLKIESDEQSLHQRPGSHARVHITGATRSGAALPLQYVYMKDHTYYIALDGIYTAVEGVPINEWFMLKDDSLLTRQVSLRGSFPLKQPVDAGRNAVVQTSQDLLVTGEISPVNTLDIILGDIITDTKVRTLVDEGAFVNKGDIVMTLEDTGIIKKIQELEDTLNESILKKEEAAEQLQIIAFNNEIDLHLLRNKSQMSTMKYERMVQHNQQKLRAIAGRTMDVVLAEINKERSETALVRMQALPSERLSQTDVMRAQRACQRTVLRHERAVIQLYLEKNAYDYHARQSAKKDTVHAAMELESRRQRSTFTHNREAQKLSVYELSEAEDRLEHQEAIADKARLVIRAPQSGVFQHNVIWDSGRLGKVLAGSSVRRYMRPVSIADYSSCVVDLELPETAYPFIYKGQQVRALIPSLENQSVSGTVQDIKYFFANKKRKDIQLGMYSEREPLGQATFSVRIALTTDAQLLAQIKPGIHVQVVFPLQTHAGVTGAQP